MSQQKRRTKKSQPVKTSICVWLTQINNSCPFTWFLSKTLSLSLSLPPSLPPSPFKNRTHVLTAFDKSIIHRIHNDYWFYVLYHIYIYIYYNYIYIYKSIKSIMLGDVFCGQIICQRSARAHEHLGVFVQELGETKIAHALLLSTRFQRWKTLGFAEGK